MANIFPDQPNSYWASTDGPVNLGTQFQVDKNTKILGLRYFKGDQANNGLVHNLRLYGASATPLATITRTQTASDPIGWVNVTLTTPVNIVPGVLYTVAWRTTGTAYTVTDTYPLTAMTRTPFILPANHAVYGYGAVAKPAGVGGYSYAIDVISEGENAPLPVRPSIKALDTDQEGITQAWFNARAAEGVQLFITAGTPWSEVGDVTVNTPRTSIREQFRMAMAAGMKIGLYTRNPQHWSAGLDAAGPYLASLQFFAVDVEPDPGQKVTQEMVNGVIARGVRPIIYAGQGFWNDIHGSGDTNFKQYPLWDTNNNPDFDYATWLTTPNVMTPTPLPFGGWNVDGNYRIGIQQRFDVTIDGVLTDLNSFDAEFMVAKNPPVIEPEITLPADQAVQWWATVTLTAGGTGTGSWTQTAGTTQTLTRSTDGRTITFTPSPYQKPQDLVFAFGGKSTKVTVNGPKHFRLDANKNLVPIRILKK